MKVSPTMGSSHASGRQESRRRHSRAGFTGDGLRYLVRDPALMAAADADLWNDRAGLHIDHRGRASVALSSPACSYYAGSFRYFYVRDDADGDLWSPMYDPVQAALDTFEFSIGRSDVQWRAVRNGLAAWVRVFVPRDDVGEVWSARLTNQSGATRSVSLYSYLPVGPLGHLRDMARYRPEIRAMVHDWFWWWCQIPDYLRTRDKTYGVMCGTDLRPTSYEINAEEFIGGKSLAAPAALSRPRLGKGEAIGDPSVAAFQFRRVLAPGQSLSVNLFLGPVGNDAEIQARRRTYLARGAAERELERAERFLRDHPPCAAIETPDRDLNHYVNHWLPARLLLMGRTMRMSDHPQSRNAIQDAMGLAYLDPEMALAHFRKIWSMQRADGWLRHGLPWAEGVTIGGIGLIPHKDIPVWGPIALHAYLCQTGDVACMQEVLPFADEPRGASLFEHITRGLDFLLGDRSPRGLCRIGEGDWNDPLNMAGWKGRGESVWLTEALAYSLDLWAQVAEHLGHAPLALRYRNCARNARDAVNKLAWDGRWYARGTTDAGKWFGVKTDKEGQIFLNAQSWAMLCGAANAKRTRACMAAVRDRLMTPFGPMKLAPTYTRMREDIGKISMKAPGASENGSVYCHAGVFYAYALYRAGQGEDAFPVLRSMLPGHAGNSLAQCGQVPTYIPNFFRGLASGKSAGRSSHSANTGTAPWYYITVMEGLLGVRAELDGLRIAPQLPAAWNAARIVRHWRGATYEITIRRRRHAKGMEVHLDGQALSSNLLPPDPQGLSHRVVVTLPA